MRDFPCDADAVIVYGAIDDPGLAVVQELAAMNGAGRRLSPRLAIARPGDPALRLNSPGWAKFDSQSVADLATHEQRVGFCRRTLLARTPLFAGPVRDLVANYLGFAGEAVERQRENLERKLAQAGLPKHGGLLDVADWFFSAYLPLPNAHVFVGNTTEDVPSFARVDCAFWTGKELIAVLLEGLTMPAPSQTRALSRLVELRPDLRVFRVRPVQSGVPAFAGGELGERLDHFADDCELPYGLFRLSAAQLLASRV